MITAIALNTFREAIRNKVLYSGFLFVALLVAGSALFGSVSVGSQIKVIKDFGLFSLSLFGAIVAVAIGVNLLNKELKQKTIYNILSKPVERWQFIVGKQLGLMFTAATLVCISGAFFILFAAAFEGRIDFLLFQAIYFVILELMIVCSLTIFFSSVVITTTLTGLFTIGAYIAGRSASYLNYFLSGEGSTTAFARGIARMLEVVLPNLGYFNIGNSIVYGIPVTPYHAMLATGYAILYSLILCTLAALIFRYRELQ